MPLYSLQCPDCLVVNEHFMGMDDASLIVDCPSCGHGLTRKHHRHYMSDVPHIQGDTVAGGCNYNYYDTGLDCHINGRRHRAEEMKRQNVTEYNPDMELQKHRQEALRIIRSAPKGDAEASKAAGAELEVAKNKRAKKNIDRVWEKAGLSSALE